MVSTWPRSVMLVPRGSVARLADQRVDVGGHRAQVTSVDADVEIGDGPDVVVRNHRRVDAAAQVG